MRERVPPHVVIQNGRLICHHCGIEKQIMLPISALLFTQQCRQFGAAHTYCEKGKKRVVLGLQEKRTALELVELVYRFAQGEVPEGVQLAENRIPHLTPDQAWGMVYLLQEIHQQLPDTIERCDVCQGLFDSTVEGTYRNEMPHQICGFCRVGEEEEDAE